MTQASASYDMNREPLTKAQVKCGEPANAPCLGKDMIMSITVNGRRQAGVCLPCRDWRNCVRIRRGEPILEPLKEATGEVSR